MMTLCRRRRRPIAPRRIILAQRHPAESHPLIGELPPPRPINRRTHDLRLLGTPPSSVLILVRATHDAKLHARGVMVIRQTLSGQIEECRGVDKWPKGPVYVRGFGYTADNWAGPPKPSHAIWVVAGVAILRNEAISLANSLDRTVEHQPSSGSKGGSSCRPPT